MRAVLALVAVAYGDSRMFLAPAAPNLSPRLAQPQPVLATGSAEPMLPAEPVMPFAYPSPQAPAASSSMVHAAASAVLVAGAAVAATSRQETAVAEPDLEAAESAAAVAMLFSSGKKAAPKKAAPKRKPATKAAPASKPLFSFGAPKPAPKKVVARGRAGARTQKKTPEGSRGLSDGDVVGFAQNFFTEKNWAYQAFTTLRDLPANNAKEKPGAATNFRRGG